jgi:hypothetical protein
MSNEYKVQNAYEGGSCQVQYVVKPETLHSVSMELPKPNHNITFTNADGHQVGVMDFNGPGLYFEGNAEEGAIVFMDWISKIFQQRLKDEYEKGFADGKASQKRK